MTTRSRAARQGAVPRVMGALILTLAAVSGSLWRRAQPPASTVPGSRVAGVSRSPEPRSSALQHPTLPVEAAAQRARLLISGVVQSTSGAPLAHASVCALHASEPCCGAESCVLSDRAGRFELDARRADEALLVASAEGYLPVRRRLSEEATAVVLTLEPGGSRVTGSVVDASGGPIARALVLAEAPGDPRSAIALSSAGGGFSITVPPGPILLTARAEGYSQPSLEVVAPTDHVQLVMSAAGSIAGRVLTEATRRSVSGVAVTAYNSNGLLAAPRSAVTDEHGDFRLERLPPGAYSLVAASAQWRSSERSTVLDFAGQEVVELLVSPATRLTGSVKVNGSSCGLGSVLLDGPTTAALPVNAEGRVEFLGVLPGAYRVHVSCASALDQDDELQIGLEAVMREWDLDQGLRLTGVATNASATPLAGVQVQVDPVGELGSRGSVACTSDARGAFDCSGLQPGEYECQLRENGIERSDSVRVSLVEGSLPAPVFLRSKPAASLHVRVEGSAALQLDALTVLARPKGKSPLVAERKGDSFVLEALPLGRYDVLLDPEVPGASRSIELRTADAVVELALSGVESRALSGRVVDESGSGVPDVWLRVSGDSLYGAVRPAPPVMSDADGSFTVPGLLPGHYDLRASGDRGQAQLDLLNDGRPVSVAMRSAGGASAH
jgi:hypothetical protein